MAAVAREIDETRDALQLNGFFFKVQLYLCIHHLDWMKYTRYEKSISGGVDFFMIIIFIS